jgi:glycosyltransferase involved in cell wall biosynthesis
MRGQREAPMKIRVSTIIPVYNGAATIAQALDSALVQSIDGDEIIVVNDGSTDGTSRLLTAYGSKIRVVELPVRRTKHERVGAGYTARNTAAVLARGDFLAFLDADDIWLPGRIAETCAALDENAQAVLAFTDILPMDASGVVGSPWVAKRPPSLDDLLTGGYGIYPSAVTMRRSLFASCGGFDNAIPYLADYDLWLRARECGEFAYVPKPLTIYRTSDFSSIADKYMSGYRPLIKKTLRRHDTKGRSLGAYFGGILASSLVAKANLQLKHRAPLSAALTLLRAIYISPSYCMRSGLLPRICRFRHFSRALLGNFSWHHK